MLFNSFTFIAEFLPLSLLGYYSTARLGRRPAILWLIIASIVFYGWWNPAFVPILLLSIGGNYLAASILIATRNRPTLQGWLLRTAVSANLLALIYYKYTTWLFGLLCGTGLLHLQLHGVGLPLGVSFFTFTQIGYLLDVCAAGAESQSALDYSAFVIFFPHLIAGPVVHHGELMPQFADAATFRFVPATFASGAGLFVTGMLKKCLLADPIGSPVPHAWEQPTTMAFFGAWQAVLSYSLQLYFDFSGYSDMAIGLGLMFNIRLPVNFDSPYKARSMVEYWQRWHISLTRYFTQYVYTPLTVAAMRRRKARRLPINRNAQMTLRGFAEIAAAPLIITILLAGIWHGAGVTFLAFGLLHAFYLTINRAYRIFCPSPVAASRFKIAWQISLTYASVLVASVFFRAPSLNAAVAMLAGLSGLHGVELPLPLPVAWMSRADGFIPAHAVAIFHPVHWRDAAQLGAELLQFASLYAIIFMVPNSQRIFSRFRVLREMSPAAGPAWLSWRPGPGWALIMGCGSAIALMALGGTAEFLYFQF